MKVKDMIGKLQTFDPETVVTVRDWGGQNMLNVVDSVENTIVKKHGDNGNFYCYFRKSALNENGGHGSGKGAFTQPYQSKIMARKNESVVEIYSK